MSKLPWYWRIDRMFFPVERFFFQVCDIIRHPVKTYKDFRAIYPRPKIGEKVMDCRYQVHVVTGYGRTKDDLILDDGRSCSWIHCCERA